MATKMQQRRATAAEWAAANPILADGEIGFERDTKVIKVGDGVTRWNSLGMPNAADAVPKSLVDAKGDILVGSADNTLVRLPRGTDGQVLKASSATESGLAWGNGGAPQYYTSGYATAAESLPPGSNNVGADQYCGLGIPSDKISSVAMVEIFGSQIYSSGVASAFYAKFFPALGYIYFQDYRLNWRRLDNGNILYSPGLSQYNGALQVEAGFGRFVKFWFDMPNNQLIVRQSNGAATSQGTQTIGPIGMTMLTSVV